MKEYKKLGHIAVYDGDRQIAVFEHVTSFAKYLDESLQQAYNIIHGRKKCKYTIRLVEPQAIIVDTDSRQKPLHKRLLASQKLERQQIIQMILSKICPDEKLQTLMQILQTFEYCSYMAHSDACHRLQAINAFIDTKTAVKKIPTATEILLFNQKIVLELRPF